MSRDPERARILIDVFRFAIEHLRESKEILRQANARLPFSERTYQASTIVFVAPMASETAALEEFLDRLHQRAGELSVEIKKWYNPTDSIERSMYYVANQNALSDYLLISELYKKHEYLNDLVKSVIHTLHRHTCI